MGNALRSRDNHLAEEDFGMMLRGLAMVVGRNRRKSAQREFFTILDCIGAKSPCFIGPGSWGSSYPHTIQATISALFRFHSEKVHRPMT
jgi:hypothetical protein